MLPHIGRAHEERSKLSLTVLGVCLFGAVLSACANEPGRAGGADGDTDETLKAQETAEKGEGMSCPVYDSRDWKAWINAAPRVVDDKATDAEKGVGKTLHIRGVVTAPTPGYSAELIPGIADRAMPPGQRFALVVTPPPPGSLVAQVLTDIEISYAGPAAYGQYREIIIHCGDKVIARITDVPAVY